MYDTLMQMGRWFGYRPATWTCADFTPLLSCLNGSPYHGCGEELREEFDLMAASVPPAGIWPKGSVALGSDVTSRLKMRTAKNLMLSFSGQLLETVVLYRDPEILRRNVETLINLVSRLPAPEVNPERMRNGSRSTWQGYLWDGVPASDVADFLTAYRTHAGAYRVNSALLSEFIRSMVTVGELTNWTLH